LLLLSEKPYEILYASCYKQSQQRLVFAVLWVKWIVSGFYDWQTRSWCVENWSCKSVLSDDASLSLRDSPSLFISQPIMYRYIRNQHVITPTRNALLIQDVCHQSSVPSTCLFAGITAYCCGDQYQNCCWQEIWKVWCKRLSFTKLILLCRPNHLLLLIWSHCRLLVEIIFLSTELTASHAQSLKFPKRV